ncbi:AMP-binding protein [Streptomyces sp. URMC 123]|uniref:AMP-binding protein n=1 Tax=Streptomyces sp. URMC 123 TaxID=3423403 RepID=UPI003F19F846
MTPSSDTPVDEPEGTLVRYPTVVDAVRAHADAAVPATVGAAGDAELPYAEFWARASGCAARLREEGVRPGDPVAVEMETATATLCAAVGVLASGAVLVPLAAAGRPRPGSVESRRTVDAIRAVGARHCLAGRGADSTARALAEAGLTTVVLPTARMVDGASAARLPPCDPDAPALVQFSSGSLAAPKGIVLSHRNLAVNLHGLVRRIAMVAARCVIWLPLSHDMGLLGSFAGSLYRGSAFRALSPRAFILDPLSWIEELSAFRATHTSAPPFGYDMAVRRAARHPARLAGLDLSSLLAAVIGAERIPPRLCERFEAAFAAYGLRRHTVLPAYGLAENGVVVALRRPLVPSAVTEADPEELERGRLTAARSAGRHGRPARPLIGHGPPVEGTEVRIVGADGERLGPGLVGEIRIGGEAACRRLVGADGDRRPARGPDGLVPTGDLGALLDGELYVVGRCKEALVHAGRTIAPADVEQTVLDAAPGQVTAAAAVGVPRREAGDDLVLFLEVRYGVTEAERARLTDAVRLAVLREFRMPVHEIHLGAYGALPRTTSGKVRRLALAAERQAKAGRWDRGAES